MSHGCNKGRSIPAFSNHERFLKFISINKDSECWEWTGKLSPEGYGRFRVKDNETWKIYGAHRVSYSLFCGDIKEGMMIDHICRNRKCVAPSHIRQVDSFTNVHENSMSITHISSLQTHCISGHELNSDNLVISKKGRRCKICHRERSTKNNADIKNKKIKINPNYGKLKTHCKWGHEFTPENTKPRPSGGRYCLICYRSRNK